jgi:hypothetical protein
MLTDAKIRSLPLTYLISEVWRVVGCGWRDQGQGGKTHG